MFLSSAQAYILIPVIAVVVAQYAFALFCLTKLAYLDISRKNYILWNVFILLVFFIGGIVFLVYYYKHPEKLIEKAPKKISESEEDKSEQISAATEEQATDPELSESDE